ncbi:hypothetical protein SAMN04489867_2317 [Pedococcus dokdonensis]|uniref:Uncharacterized protein n=1 Tax=Pedococcus dokdonensis TaxID=443156 RepID=A0A1H0SDN4_9MICO|nr:hypothetical protein [Pedococcus dokdonensis]SDP39844.1 hypothetical protein SAMN04489867_2317 [Pedococcus dokdonensis]
MQPSSLVFLVIIAVWAAYFVQYWVRRREHLATARSVDQFSESMRVLERRSPLPASDLSTPQPRSYAVTPARVARPQVLVKRAVNTPSAPEPPAASKSPAAAVTETPTPSAPRRTPSTARRTRAVIMLGALATVLVVAPLVAMALVPLAAIAVPVVAVGGALTWSRATVQAERRARLAARRSVRPAPRPAAPVAPAAGRVEVNTSGHPGASTSNDEKILAPTPEAAPAKQRDELYDVQAIETGRRQPATPEPAAVASTTVEPSQSLVPARPLVDEDDIPLTWDPVPVPRPTYTMKARVTRPAPTAADLVGDADTEYADGEHTAYDQTPERRVAGA